MFLNRIFSLKRLILDFMYMFIANIFMKVFGFLREVILAYIFGTSLLYSFYILLRTAADILSQFTFGSALQANILPKLSKHFNIHEKVSYNNLFQFTKKSSIYIYITSQIIQLIIIFILDSDYTYELVFLSFFLSFLVVFNFFNSIFLTVLQSEGNFKDYSIASTLNLFLATLFLYPAAILFNVIGIVVSRMIGVISLARQYVLPILRRDFSNEVDIGIKDFSLSVVLLGNLPNFILLSSGFIAGTDGDNNIAYFNYAVVLLNVLLTAIIANINTLMLRKLSISKEIKWLYYSLCIALICGFMLFLFASQFSVPLIELLYHRGAFTYFDVLQTASYFKDMTLAIVILLISSVLSQPYFILDVEYRSQYSKILSVSILISFLVVVSSFYFNDWDARLRSLVMLYSMSLISLLLSIFTCMKYFEHES